MSGLLSKNLLPLCFDVSATICFALCLYWESRRKNKRRMTALSMSFLCRSANNFLFCYVPLPNSSMLIAKLTNTKKTLAILLQVHCNKWEVPKRQTNGFLNVKPEFVILPCQKLVGKFEFSLCLHANRLHACQMHNWVIKQPWMLFQCVLLTLEMALCTAFPCISSTRLCKHHGHLLDNLLIAFIAQCQCFLNYTNFVWSAASTMRVIE